MTEIAHIRRFKRGARNVDYQALCWEGCNAGSGVRGSHHRGGLAGWWTRDLDGDPGPGHTTSIAEDTYISTRGLPMRPDRLHLVRPIGHVQTAG